MNESLEQEIWKDIPNYEGLYKVSNFGKVKSLSREILSRGKYPFISKEKLLKAHNNQCGYAHVVLYKNSKTKQLMVHQLVAMAFLGHVPNGHEIEVNHKDKNKSNNNLSNIEILTKVEHTKHTRPNKSSQYTGVSFCKRSNKWCANISVNGKQKNLGRFNDEFYANNAFQKAKEMLANNDLSFLNPKKYTSEYVGVFWNSKNKKWNSEIKINGVSKHLGSFKYELEAYEARKKAEQMYNNGDLSFIKIRKKSSQYKGVSFHKQHQKWSAKITFNNKQNHLGLFDTEYDAHLAYEKAKNNK